MRALLETVLPGVQHIQNIHPLVIHFPIAFLIGAALLYVMAYLFRSDRLANMAFVLLFLGTFSALVAVGTGLYAEHGVMISRSVRLHLLNLHKQLMLIALWWSTVLLIWATLRGPFPQKGRMVFLMGIFILVLILIKGADYGGRMVYDYNAGGDACSQPIDFNK